MRPYLRFIFNDSSNRRYLFIAVAAILLQFIVFKWLYPFGDYFTDSYSYISAAANHDKVSFRPIGYSWFLRGVHAVTASETALIYIQYLLLQLGALHLFFSTLYFYRPGKTTCFLLFVVLQCNPVMLYLANFISSDALFTVLSLFWWLQWLWTLRRPRLYQLPILGLLLYGLLQTRLTALYYPLTGVMALLLLHRKGWYKAGGIALLGAVTMFCIVSVQRTTQAVTGTKVFSAFSGWQWANNALHVYCHVSPDTNGLPSACGGIDSFVGRYFDTARTRRIRAGVTTDYMWDEDKPLKQYMDYYRHRNNLSYFDAWNAVAPVYSTYAFYLIKKHPAAYTQYFLLPNAKIYLLPSLEVMYSYNQGVDSIGEPARRWFGYPQTRVHCVSRRLQRVVLWPVPPVFLLLHLFFAAGLCWFLWSGAHRRADAFFSRMLFLSVLFAAINAAFIIAATPSSVRYEAFPLLLLACSTLLLYDKLLGKRTIP